MTLVPFVTEPYDDDSDLETPARVPVAEADPQALARIVFDALADKQAVDIVILDLRPLTIVADYFVIGTANSR